MTNLAQHLQRSEAQVYLRWALQKRYITIPKSATESRIRENSQLYDFQIPEEDMRRIDDQSVDDVIISFACKSMLHSWNAIKDRDIPGSWRFEDAEK